MAISLLLHFLQPSVQQIPACTPEERSWKGMHLQFLIFSVCYISHLFLDSRLQLHEVHHKLQCTRLQGARKEEGILLFQTSCTFKVCWVSELWLYPLVMSGRLKIELLWYECWLSSVPFIDTAWSKLHALLHDSGKRREVHEVPCLYRAWLQSCVWGWLIKAPVAWHVCCNYSVC